MKAELRWYIHLALAERRRIIDASVTFNHALTCELDELKSDATAEEAKAERDRIIDMATARWNATRQLDPVIEDAFIKAEAAARPEPSILVELLAARKVQQRFSSCNYDEATWQEAIAWHARPFNKLRETIEWLPPYPEQEQVVVVKPDE